MSRKQIFSVALDPELRDTLRRIAVAERTSVGHVIRRAIQREIARVERWNRRERRDRADVA